MIKQFDGIELPWGKVNGSFIVSENIADNGGMAVTLDIMSRMENANYEQYFINWAKSQEIPVGPGRGSAAGSIVSYCLHITNIDPIRYNLLFERFLNPERVSMRY